MSTDDDFNLDLTTAEVLAEKIRSRTARVGVVGLGYVGLPLAVEYAQAGYNVTGIDLSEGKVARINAGDSYIGDVPSSALEPLVGNGKLRATTDFSVIRDLDTVNICVPTPLRKTKDPDMSYIVAACEEIAKYFHPGMLVILESTTYPGTTDELVLPMLEKSGLKVGRRFLPLLLAGARRSRQPEIPDEEHSQSRGRDHAGLHRARASLLFAGARNSGAGQFDAGRRDGETARKYVPHDQHRTGRTRWRIMCDGMGINVWEVIEAAATKPFGFMPFYPGPGLGGHCIPIDPFYLSWKTKQAGIEARFIELAGLYQRADAALCGDEGAECAERRRQAGEGIEDSYLRRVLQAGHRRRARISGARHHPPAAEARRVDFILRSARAGDSSAKMRRCWRRTPRP